MGNYSNWIWAVAVYVIVFTLICFLYMRIKARRDSRINKSSSLSKNSAKNRLYFFYRLFRAVPGINRIFEKVIEQTKSVFPADTMSVNKEATKIMLKTSGISLLLILVTIIFGTVLGGGDLWYILMGITGSIIVFYQNVHTTFVKKEFTLLVQLRDALSAIKHHYLNERIVEDAVDDSLDEVPYEISLHLSKIHEILTSPLIDEDTEEYTEMSPNRFLLLLLSICSSTKEYSNGEDGFLKSLSYLKEEIGQEILKKKRIKSKFSTMQGASICCIFLLKPIEIWANGNMPETEGFYSGIYGRAMMIGIFLTAFACFHMIDVLKESRRGEIIRQSIWNRVASIHGISTLLNKVINKNYVHYLNINEDLKEVGDQTGPKAFLAKQCVFALAAFVFMNSTVLYSTVQKKLTMLNEYVAEFDSSVIPNEKYRVAMSDLAQNYVLKYKDMEIKEEDEELLVKVMRESGKVTNETYAHLVAQEVIKELTAYKNTYYKWYVLLLSIAVSVIMFFVPRVYLKFKIKISNTNKEEEVNQFQTLILILMNADGIQLDEILDWINRFSYSFKSSIEECILNLENGVQKSLETLKYSEKNTSFQRFVDCLLMIDETDIKTAFSEVELDRAYALLDRQQETESTIQSRSMIGKILALMPIMLTFGGYLFAPMAVLAIKMYLEMNLAIG